MSNNDNVNETKMLINNDNDIGKFDKADKVESTAMQLVTKFKNEDGYKFYCKVAYRLPENVIWNLYEASLKGKNPAKLFSWLATREMYRRA